MAEPAVLWSDAGSTPSAPAPTLTPDASDAPARAAAPVESLEQRVQRLEATVAALQDTQALEQRIVDTVVQQLQGKVAAEAERLAGERLVSERRASATLMMSAAEKALRAASPLVSPTASHASWMAVDMVLELVAIFRMFFDFRYKVGWTTRVLVLLLLPAILTSNWWFPGTNLEFLGIGRILDKLVDLALAFIMYKALSREAQRYQQMRSP
jgi:hypothetical protein